MAMRERRSTLNTGTFPVDTVGLINSYDITRARRSSLFTNWLDRINNDNPEWAIHGITLHGVHSCDDEVKMIHFVADITDADGNKLPGIVLLRGDTVDVLTVIRCQGEDYFVFVSQLRAAAGGDVLSNPSGMVDNHEPTAYAALRELAEETGISIGEGNLIELFNNPTDNPYMLYVSPGVSDERAAFYAYTMNVKPDLMIALTDHIAGKIEEGEQTRLHVVRERDVLDYLHDQRVGDLKTWFSILLYWQYYGHG
jgi:8-oxo-dGTP pyrophosphatase MutT (NUDIX family)